MLAGIIPAVPTFQDFNPGGPSIGAGFISDLHRAHPNFRVPALLDRLGMARHPA